MYFSVYMFAFVRVRMRVRACMREYTSMCSTDVQCEVFRRNRRATERKSIRSHFDVGVCALRLFLLTSYVALFANG